MISSLVSHDATQLMQQTNTDQKPFEIKLSIANCHQIGDDTMGNSVNVLIRIRRLCRSYSIVAYTVGVEFRISNHASVASVVDGVAAIWLPGDRLCRYTPTGMSKSGESFQKPLKGQLIRSAFRYTSVLRPTTMEVQRNTDGDTPYNTELITKFVSHGLIIMLKCL